MGASRILSAKKHSEKVSKYSALLYASYAHTSFPRPSFRDSGYWYKAGFLSMVGPLGCGLLFFIGCSTICFGWLFGGYNSTGFHRIVSGHWACFKIHFCQLCVTVCGRFVPDEGRIAGYVTWIRGKYAAKWDVQMAGRNFNTRSSCEMHQDFAANARVPPKSASGRLENANSALSIPNQCPGPLPSLSYTTYWYKASLISKTQIF